MQNEKITLTNHKSHSHLPYLVFFSTSRESEITFNASFKINKMRWHLTANDISL